MAHTYDTREQYEKDFELFNDNLGQVDEDMDPELMQKARDAVRDFGDTLQNAGDAITDELDQAWTNAKQAVEDLG